jgi:hypothetical protein
MRTISLERRLKTWFLTYPLKACPKRGLGASYAVCRLAQAGRAG